MAEMRIGVANGGAVINGVSGVGTGATGQAAPPASPAGALVGAVEAGIAPQAAPAVAAAAPAAPPVQAAWQAAPPATALQPAAPQAAPYSPPAAAPPTAQTPYTANNAYLTPSNPSSSSSETSTTLSSSSAAAIAVPLTVVACAILLLAGLIWWYKRHPPHGRRRGDTERDEMSMSEKALVVPGYASQIRTGSVRSVASTAAGSVRGVTVTPHVETPSIARPPPSVAPSIASIRRPTSMNITKPLPPISEYGGSSSSGSSARTHSTVPVIHSATVGRRADAQVVHSPSPKSRSVHPIHEEHEPYDGGDDVSTAPNSPRTQIRAEQATNAYFSTSRMTASSVGSPLPRRSGPPAGSVYSTHSLPVQRKRNGPTRRPIPVNSYVSHSLPASIARNAPVSTVRRSLGAAPGLGHSPQSSCESDSLPEIVDLPAGHPFARKYAGSSASSSRSRPHQSDETESMIRSITAGTELTLPWGFSEAGKGKKYEDGVEPLRKPEKEAGAKLFREETRRGADWARERSY